MVCGQLGFPCQLTHLLIRCGGSRRIVYILVQTPASSIHCPYGPNVAALKDIINLYLYIFLLWIWLQIWNCSWKPLSHLAKSEAAKLSRIISWTSYIIRNDQEDVVFWIFYASLYANIVIKITSTSPKKNYGCP